MKNFKTLFALMLVVLLGFTSSCSDDKKDDPKPVVVSEAKSSFGSDRKIVEVNEVVTFSNTSTNATRYEWDFGNGQSSTVANPTATYATTGTYTVKLTAYNSENKASVSSKTIKVGERYFTGITITSLNFSNATGSPWDYTDGPDLRLSFKKSSISTWTYYNLKENVVQTDLPLAYALAEPYTKFTEENWDFKVEDIDPGFSNEIMGSWTDNPLRFSKDPTTGDGYFLLTKGPLNIRLLFEVK